ncbi:peptide transporter, partial [Salmonella enterica subsp. enterica serovar Paratyphi B]|nr:peptide transporter [Salmonella enterica subsp. enterica serovar Paratyphi B]
ESNLFVLEDIIDKVKEETADLDINDIPEAQKIVMEQITKAVELLAQKPPSKSWETRDLASFANKDKYARISKNSSGRKIRFEFNRMSSELMAEIEAFITEKLSSEK